MTNAPEIRAGATTRLWLFLSRVIRPDPDVVFPSLVRIEPSSVVLSLVWVALAFGLLAAGWWLLHRRGDAVVLPADGAVRHHERHPRAVIRGGDVDPADLPTRTNTLGSL